MGPNENTLVRVLLTETKGAGEVADRWDLCFGKENS